MRHYVNGKSTPQWNAAFILNLITPFPPLLATGNKPPPEIRMPARRVTRNFKESGSRCSPDPDKNTAKTLSGDGSRQCMFNLFVAQSLDEFNSFSEEKVTAYVMSIL
jgi:hypothetical protein